MRLIERWARTEVGVVMSVLNQVKQRILHDRGMCEEVFDSRQVTREEVQHKADRCASLPDTETDFGGQHQALKLAQPTSNAETGEYYSTVHTSLHIITVGNTHSTQN